MYRNFMFFNCALLSPARAKNHNVEKVGPRWYGSCWKQLKGYIYEVNTKLHRARTANAPHSSTVHLRLLADVKNENIPRRLTWFSKQLIPSLFLVACAIEQHT